MTRTDVIGIVLFAVLLVLGGWRLYVHLPRDSSGVVARGDGDEQEELLGFQRRIVEWIGRFMRRFAVAMIVLTGLIVLSLAVSILLVAKQREDDRQQQAQVDTNQRLLARMDADLQDRRERASATDRQQCEDIERLKADARASARRGRTTIRALRGLPQEDKARLLVESRRSEARFAPRTVRTKAGDELKGLAACTALPNSERP